MKLTTKLWIGLALLTILSPIGLLLPEHFKAGAAWGEWGVEEIRGLVGYVPKGLERLAGLWSAPIPDYAFRGWEEKGLPRLSLVYILSAAAGILVTVIGALLLGKILARKDD